MKTPWHSWFSREKKKAKRLVKDPAAVLRTLDKAGRKAGSNRGPLGRLWDDLQTAIRLVRSWARGEYPGISRSTIVLVVGGLLYLLSPIDAIIDAIPVLGFMDDAMVLGWVFGQVRGELDAFREWERAGLLTEAPGTARAAPALPSG